MNGRTDGRVDERMAVSADEQMEGWMDGRDDGLVDLIDTNMGND